MAKYKLLPQGGGIFDTETKAHIPDAPGNRHWQEYQQWLTEGSPVNTPDPAYSNAELKQNKKNDINTEREVHLNEGLVFESNSYDTNQRSRENLSGVVAYISSGNTVGSSFTWRASDNQNISMDDAKVVQFGAAMISFITDIYSTSWILKAQVDALDENASDFEDQINAIQWPVGSP